MRWDQFDGQSLSQAQADQYKVTTRQTDIISENYMTKQSKNSLFAIVILVNVLLYKIFMVNEIENLLYNIFCSFSIYPLFFIFVHNPQTCASTG